MTQGDLYIDRDASMSEDQRYRWTLSRNWDPSLRQPWCMWIMLNPSTADANVDDRTIRRCMGFARDWGFGGIHVMNLFALRATDPQALKRAEHPIAPAGQEKLYDALLLEVCTDAVSTCIVAAWGTHGSHLGRDRHVLQMLQAAGVQLQCLGTTDEGHPRHPLYLPSYTKLEPFPRATPPEGEHR